METWKPVAGYESIYEVSDLGRVRSLDRIVTHSRSEKRIKGTVLKHSLSRNYAAVTLCREGSNTTASVHRLVASAFCDRPDGCDVVNHIDGMKLNNSAANLEWTTTRGNCVHAYENGLSVAVACERSGRAKLTNKQVRKIRTSIIDGVQLSIIAKEHGVSYATISGIRSGRNWTRDESSLIDACKTSRRNVGLPSGENHCASVFTKELAEEVIRRICSGESQKSIAESLSISRASICRINTGQSWGRLRVDGCGSPPYTRR